MNEPKDQDESTVVDFDDAPGANDTQTGPPPEMPPHASDEDSGGPASRDATSDPVRLSGILESLLFVSDRPLTVDQLRAAVGVKDAKLIRQALLDLTADTAARGVVVHEVAGGWQMRTHPQNAEWVQKVLAARPVRLSRAQLETLAIVAYRQPITRPEVDEIRGVDSGATLKLLMDRDLIRILGKKEEPGRPLLYGTTKIFLEFFNLKDLRDLPTLREFHELSAEHQAKVDELDSGGDSATGAAGESETGAGAAERAEHVAKLGTVDEA